MYVLHQAYDVLARQQDNKRTIIHEGKQDCRLQSRGCRNQQHHCQGSQREAQSSRELIDLQHSSVISENTVVMCMGTRTTLPLTRLLLAGWRLRGKFPEWKKRRTIPLLACRFVSYIAWHSIAWHRGGTCCRVHSPCRPDSLVLASIIISPIPHVMVVLIVSADSGCT